MNPAVCASLLPFSAFGSDFFGYLSHLSALSLRPALALSFFLLHLLDCERIVVGFI